jgi:regulator of RNase E activity RraA
MSTAARQRGCTGAVVDGGVRDTSFYACDFIMGDIDGVVVIRQAVAYDILAEAEEISVREQKMRAELREGVRITEVYKKYGGF